MMSVKLEKEGEWLGAIGVDNCAKPKSPGALNSVSRVRSGCAL